MRERFDEDAALVPVIDFLSAARGLRVIVSEYEQVEEQARKVREQLETSFGDAAARGHVVTIPPDQAFIGWTEIEPRAAGAARLEELAVGDEAEVRHVPCQPAMEFRGRVNDWVAEIRELRERGDTILFVADSHGRAPEPRMSLSTA